MTALRMFVLGMVAAVVLYFAAVYLLVAAAVRVVEHILGG
jgi:hypothetical protein